MITHGRGVYRPGGGCRACVCDGGRDPTRTPAVLCSCQAGACADASTTRRLHAYVCEGAVENSWQSRPRHTHARNKVLLSATLVVPSAQPPKSECERAARRLPAKRRRRPTFFAIVLASSSNMTRARSAAVVGVGLKTACLGLDCHEFSSKPSHTHAWSTRFLPGHMFPVKAQTITAVARVLKRCERARLRLEAPQRLGVAMGADAAMRRGPALILTCFRGCVLACAHHVTAVAVARCAVVLGAGRPRSNVVQDNVVRAASKLLCRRPRPLRTSQICSIRELLTQPRSERKRKTLAPTRPGHLEITGQ